MNDRLPRAYVLKMLFISFSDLSGPAAESNSWSATATKSAASSHDEQQTNAIVGT